MISRKNMMTALASAMMLTMAVPNAMAATTATPAKAVAVVYFKGAADAFLKQIAASYNLPADLSDLQYVSTTTTDAASYVRYQQTVNGAELFTHQVVVTLNSVGQGVLVVSDYVPNLQVEAASTKIGENNAEAKALEHVKAKSLKSATSRTFGYFVQDGVAIPSYKVVITANDPENTFETIVHAGTGKVLKSRDLNEKATGTGKVFLPNPVRTQGSATGLTDMVNEVHSDGEIWSQGEYEMAKAFGRDVATKIIIQSHFSLTPNSGFNNGAHAIKQADQLLYGGAYAAQIDAIWAARGISPN